MNFVAVIIKYQNFNNDVIFDRFPFPNNINNKTMVKIIVGIHYLISEKQEGRENFLAKCNGRNQDSSICLYFLRWGIATTGCLTKKKKLKFGIVHLIFGIFVTVI